LNRLQVSVFDKDDNLLQSRFLDQNGTAPSIMMLPQRIWNGRATQLIFNPFSEFEISAPIHSLKYEWTFTNSSVGETVITSTVLPVSYVPKIKLDFPLKGRILVYDAHDHNSHHRRFDYNFAPIKDFGITSNFMRYAYDFVILNNENQQFNNNGKTNEDYFGFESEVYAVADGKVIYVSGKHKDDNSFDVAKLKENPLELYGNCVAIQHDDNSISIYGHLRENSIKVKLGDKIKSKQAIALLGVSGSSFFPHLHFEVRTSIDNGAEGLPSYFENTFLVEGKVKKKTDLRPGGNGKHPGNKVKCF
jgi:murein DD-endopeptidase MepM/ murein hydrolase activator NlpD